MYNCYGHLQSASTGLGLCISMLHAVCAAEIAETYPDKAITLVQSHEELVPGYSARMSRRILRVLRGLKVEASNMLPLLA